MSIKNSNGGLESCTPRDDAHSTSEDKQQEHVEEQAVAITGSDKQIDVENYQGVR